MRLTPLLLALGAAIASTDAAWALHRDTGPAARITRGAGETIPHPRGWRTWLPLTSTEDLTGTGNAGRQAFVFDLWTFDCTTRPNGVMHAACPVHLAPYLTQVTSGPGTPDHPAVSGVGRVIAFDADGTYGGGVGAGTTRRQIFLLDRQKSTLLSITTAGDGDSVNPALDDAGRYVAFESTAALLGGPSGISQIFVYDVGTGELEQVTHGAGESHDPTLDKTGKRVAFASTADLLGDGHETGVSQIFWANRPFDQVHQLTNGNASSRRPYLRVLKPSSKLRTLLGLTIVSAGYSVVFESDATDLLDTRGTPGPQVYFGSIRGSDLPPIVQITPPPVAGCDAGPGATAVAPTADPTGRAIFFTSTADLLCNGTSGQRLFRFVVAGRPGLAQITAAGDVAGPAQALDGWCVALSSSEDLSGTGVCGHEVQVLNFFDGMWHETTVVGQLPEERSPGPADAACDDLVACTADACTPSGCTHTPIPGCSG